MTVAGRAMRSLTAWIVGHGGFLSCLAGSGADGLPLGVVCQAAVGSGAAVLWKRALAASALASAACRHWPGVRCSP